MSDEVPWEKVAAYYLSVSLKRASFRDAQVELERLTKLDGKALKHLLKYEVHSTSSVRHIMLEGERVKWERRQLPLGALKIGPGAAHCDYRRVAVQWDDADRTVARFCEWFDAQPLSKLLSMDESITSFIPAGPIPEAMQVLIVGDRDYRKGTRPRMDRILSGYPFSLPGLVRAASGRLGFRAG